MVRNKRKKEITLIGRLITPLITPQPSYKQNGCGVRILRDLKTEKKGRLAIVGKVVKGEQKGPTLLRGFRGVVRVSCVDESEERARTKIESFFNKDHLGSATTEGYGEVDWLELQVTDYQPQKPNR